MSEEHEKTIIHIEADNRGLWPKEASDALLAVLGRHIYKQGWPGTQRLLDALAALGITEET